jgi:hypothetical protein
VAYYTGQWYLAEFGEAGGGAVAAAAVGGAAGSAAGQLVGMALGVQDRFSWRAVAAGALAGAVTAGLGLNGLSQTNPVLGAVASSVVNQSVNMALGLQKEFNWKSVACSAFAAAASSSINGSLFGQDGAAVEWSKANPVGTVLATNAVSALVSATTRLAVTGGKISWESVAADALSGAVQSMLNSAGQDKSNAGNGLKRTTSDNPLGLSFASQTDCTTKQEVAARFVPTDGGSSSGDGDPSPNSMDIDKIAGDVARYNRILDKMAATYPGYSREYIDSQIRKPVGNELGIAESLTYEKGLAFQADIRNRRESMPQFGDRLVVGRGGDYPEYGSGLLDLVNLRSEPDQAPISVQLSPTQAAVLQGVGNVTKGLILGAAEMTVLPIGDVLQTIPKLIHSEVTGEVVPLTPLSSYANDVVNEGAGFWQGIKTTATNVFEVSPPGMVYGAGRGGYQLGTAMHNGNVAGMTEASLGLGLTFAGARASGISDYGISYEGITVSGPGKYQTGAVGRFKLVTPEDGGASEFLVAKHGDMPSPRPGEQSHHGVMSAWMEKNYPGYDPDLAPAILMPEANHRATFGVYNTWRVEMRQELGGTFDWARVPESNMQDLSERMFDAAKVPTATRHEYWDWYQSMKGALTREQ